MSVPHSRFEPGFFCMGVFRVLEVDMSAQFSAHAHAALASFSPCYTIVPSARQFCPHTHWQPDPPRLLQDRSCCTMTWTLLPWPPGSCTRTSLVAVALARQPSTFRAQMLIYCVINLSAPELFFIILAHPVYKIWIIQEPNTLEFETNCILKRKKNGEYIPCLKYSVPIFVE